MSHRSAFIPTLESLWVALELHILRLRYHYISVILALAVLCGSLWHLFLSPPAAFPAGHIITIETGAPVSEIATALHGQNLLRSPILFEATVRILGRQNSIQAGKYVFAEPIGLLRLFNRVVHGEYGITPTRVVITEGLRVREIDRLLKEDFPDFDENAFLVEALPLEGYLFPDTYFFYPDVTPDEVVDTMYGNFKNNKETIQDDIDAFDKPFPDDLAMASLLEKEARSLAEKRMVAGILWNRIERGMPLQVDAVFGYINDVPIYSPHLSDLDVESPYNTYQHKGLPPGPIGNPGIVSLLAAVTPTKSDYLYYLTGKNGKMYYAKTFEQHKRNRALYLD